MFKYSFNEHKIKTQWSAYNDIMKKSDINALFSQYYSVAGKFYCKMMASTQLTKNTSTFLVLDLALIKGWDKCLGK